MKTIQLPTNLQEAVQVLETLELGVCYKTSPRNSAHFKKTSSDNFKCFQGNENYNLNVEGTLLFCDENK